MVLEFVNVFNKQTVNRTAAINKTLIIYLDMYVTVGKLGEIPFR
jgi:hypothetical protein